MKTSDYRDLEVWKRSVEWSCSIIRWIGILNLDRKHFRLIEQIESSSTSVPMNIAEGKGRNSKKEFIQFLYIARGSINETVTLLIIFSKLGWIDTTTFNSFVSEGEEISKMLNGLINSIKETME